jgi:hypothetical protein
MRSKARLVPNGAARGRADSFNWIAIKATA